jgi:ketosteroid isomerase-like protein
MSQDKAELLHRASGAFNRRDIDAFLALTDPEVEFTPPNMGLEGGGTFRGHHGVRSWWENLLDVSPDFRAEFDEVRDLGDVTVARIRIHGHGVLSGAPMEQTSWQFAEWRQDRCVRWRTFPSEAEALEAAAPPD